MERLFGECRCCLSKGNHRSLLKEYFIEGKRVVFKENLLQCFNILLSSNSSLPTLICEECVRRLREAHSFRSQVQQTETQLLKTRGIVEETEFVDVTYPYTAGRIWMSSRSQGAMALIRGDFCLFLKLCLKAPKVWQPISEVVKLCAVYESSVFFPVLLQQNVKQYDVQIKEETDFCEYEDSVLQEQNTNEEDEVVKEEIEGGSRYDECDLEDLLVPGEREVLSRYSDERLRLPTRHDLIKLCPTFHRHLESLKGKIIKARTIKPLLSPRTHFPISEKLAQAINAATLLENSTATVFKNKMRDGFPCFYCRLIFINPKTLREHQLTHPKALLYKLLTKYTADALVVYADITDLKCSICNENVASLNILKSHLVDVHHKKMYVGYSDRVIPFRLDDKQRNFDCQLCGRSFETFGATDRHMNVHFSNYVCEECGSGFVTKHRLKVHTYLMHSRHTSVIKCELCKKIFASKFKLKIHNEYVHKKLKKMQCSQCSEKFIDFFSRQRHMEEKHGVEILSYKCTECDRAFNRKYSLTCHIKRIHLVRKDVQCELCPFMCFNKSELKDHMYKHGGDKTFECMMCQKSFARKKTLKVHMRVHGKDKKYSCHFCGETFVQNCNLKSHLKTHNSYVDL